jgi:hypothetical protein
MKVRRMAIVVGVAVLALFVIPRASFAAAGSGRIPVTDYTLRYTWHGFTPGYTGLHLYSDHSFTTDDGADGSWQYDMSSQTIDIQFATGCLPLYEGQLKGGTASFKGTQVCTDGSGGYGRWGAKAATGPTGSHGSSSQPG